RTDAGGGWLRVQLGKPGVLLLRRLGPRRTEGVAVAMFGLSLVRACSSACSLNNETTSQLSNLSSHDGGIPARPETGVGRSTRTRLGPERYRKRTYGAEPVAYILLVAACRHQP